LELDFAPKRGHFSLSQPTISPLFDSRQTQDLSLFGVEIHLQLFLISSVSFAKMRFMTLLKTAGDFQDVPGIHTYYLLMAVLAIEFQQPLAPNSSPRMSICSCRCCESIRNGNTSLNWVIYSESKE